MKGLINALIVGVCILLAAAVIVGALTFPEAIGILWTLIFWILVLIGVFVLGFLIFVIIISLIGALI